LATVAVTVPAVVTVVVDSVMLAPGLTVISTVCVADV
jgi:hypothetical protein